MAHNIEDIVSVAVPKYLSEQGKAFDLVFQKQAYIQFLGMKDKLEGDPDLKRIDTQNGGKHIEHQLMVAEGGTFKWYSNKGDVIEFEYKDIFENTQWTWKNAVGTLVLPVPELLEIENNEKSITSYLQGRLLNTKMQLVSAINAAFWTASPGTKEIVSIPKLIQFDPTTTETIGNIDQGAHTWWRNSTVTSAATTYKLFVKEIRDLYDTLAYNSQGFAPDLLIMGREPYTYVREYLGDKAIPNATDEQMSKMLGFKVPKIDGMTVLREDQVPNVFGSGDYASVYMINSAYMKFTVHSQRKFTLGPKERLIVNGDDAIMWPIYLKCGNTCSNRTRLGVIGKIPKTITS